MLLGVLLLSSFAGLVGGFLSLFLWRSAALSSSSFCVLLPFLDTKTLVGNGRDGGPAGPGSGSWVLDRVAWGAAMCRGAHGAFTSYIAMFGSYLSLHVDPSAVNFFCDPIVQQPSICKFNAKSAMIMMLIVVRI